MSSSVIDHLISNLQQSRSLDKFKNQKLNLYGFTSEKVQLELLFENIYTWQSQYTIYCFYKFGVLKISL